LRLSRRGPIFGDAHIAVFRLRLVHPDALWTFHVDGTTGRSLYGEPNIRLHASYARVRGNGMSYEATSVAWPRDITRQLLNEAVSLVPNEWATPAELAELVDFLDARASIAEDQRRELTRVTA
jgi:hypothetical protein